MPTDESCPSCAGGDDISAGATDSPLAPYLSDTLDAVAAELGAASAAHGAAIEEVLAPVESELRAASADHNAALAAELGRIDSELRAVAPGHFRAIEQLADAVFRETVYAQETMRAEGHQMPMSGAAAMDILNDPTGAALFSGLTGTSGPTVTTPVSEPPVYEVSPPPPPPPPPGLVTKPDDPRPPLVLPPPPPPSPPPPPGTSPPPPPPPPGPPPPPREKTCAEECPPKCPEKPCEPPASWPRSQVCPKAKPFYGDPEKSGAKQRGDIFFDSYTLHWYYHPGAGCDPGPDISPTVSGYGPGGVAKPGAEVARDTNDEERPAFAGAFDASGYDWVGWGRNDACATVQAVVRRESARGSNDLAALETGGSTVSTVYRGIAASVKSLADGVFAGAPERVRNAAFDANVDLTGDIFGGFSSVKQLFTYLDTGALEDAGAAWGIGLKLALAHNAEEHSGFPAVYCAQSLQYAFQYANPQYIPTQSELNGLLLSGSMLSTEWTCLTRALGNIPELQARVVESARLRPNADQKIALWRRGVYPDKDALYGALGEEGLTQTADADKLVKLSEFVPTPPDVVRFMVRDVFDDSVARDQQLDKDFATKLYGAGGRDNPGPAAQMIRAHGVTEDVMRHYWRAHWEHPSPTQLYEMLHRLRPDRPEAQRWQEGLNRAEDQEAYIRANPPPPVMTMEDARRILEIDDKAPGTIDHLLAVSYNPMTRTDALNAYHANVMTEDELRERLRDTGLDLPTATRTVEIQRALRARRTANVSGVWTIRKVARYFKVGALTGEQASDLLTPLVPDPQQRQRIIDGCLSELDAEAQEAKVKRLRRALIVGEMAAAQVDAALDGMGIAVFRREALLGKWLEERDGRYREATARQISDWVASRIMTAEQAYARLQRLGYILVDAQYIVVQALVRAGEKVQSERKAKQAEMRRIIADERAARRASERELTQREKDIQKEIEKLEKERERILKEQEERRV